MQNQIDTKLDAIAESAHCRRNLVGSKPPLQSKHVWAIRTRLQLSRRLRDLALFNLAIDGKLRGCDLVNLRVRDVAPHGYTLARVPRPPVRYHWLV
jgi:hypothetical protein